ncbi:MAG: CheR family methyltransferase [Campylobacterota bacterium]
MLNWFFKNKKQTPLPAKKEDPPEITDTYNFDRLIETFKEQTGVEFESKRSIFENKVINFAKNNGLHSVQSCIDLMRGPETDLKDKLIDVLTTNETYFFREMVQIEDLARKVKAKGSPVRILSAPCASGEEPYTIAMTLLEAGISPSRFEITAIDISRYAIEFAKKGCYRPKSLRKTPAPIEAKYFTTRDELKCLQPLVKDTVTFQVANVFDPAFKQLGKFDYIFSRNMLIYFDHPTKKKVKALLESMLKDPRNEIYFGHADLF